MHRLKSKAEGEREVKRGETETRRAGLLAPLVSLYFLSRVSLCTATWSNTTPSKTIFGSLMPWAQTAAPKEEVPETLPPLTVIWPCPQGWR